MAPAANAAFTEFVLSPRWGVTVGNVDGTPRSLDQASAARSLDFLLLRNDVVELPAALEKSREPRNEAPMLTKAPQDGPAEAACGYRWKRLIRAEPTRCEEEPLDK